jgi:hypothetical protein
VVMVRSAAAAGARRPPRAPRSLRR